jgi:hypothetical protein
MPVWIVETLKHRVTLSAIRGSMSRRPADSTNGEPP